MDYSYSYAVSFIGKSKNKKTVRRFSEMDYWFGDLDRLNHHTGSET